MNKTLKISSGICVQFFCALLYFTHLSAETTQIQEPITVEEIQTIDYAGTYPVIVETSDEVANKTSKIIYITVRFPKTVRSEQYSEAIDAHDIRMEQKNFANYTDANLVHLAGAHAWSTQDGSNIAIVSVEQTCINELYYQIRFATARGTATTINVLLYEKINMNYTYSTTYLPVFQLNFSLAQQFFIGLSVISFFRWG